MADLGNISAVSAEPVTFPPTELLFSVAETDKLLPAVIAGQTVWLSAAEAVPPVIAALVTAENLFSGICRWR